jgi:hypothetical protein
MRDARCAMRANFNQVLQGDNRACGIGRTAADLGLARELRHGAEACSESVPCGVLVSIGSRSERKFAPLAAISSTTSRRWLMDRARPRAWLRYRGFDRAGRVREGTNPSLRRRSRRSATPFLSLGHLLTGRDARMPICRPVEARLCVSVGIRSPGEGVWKQICKRRG